jgi:RNA polymerase sigma-70 factor (ECF subfamily)
VEYPRSDYGNADSISNSAGLTNFSPIDCPPDPRKNELTLVRQAQAGDQGAFARLINPHIRETYHVALKITHNREDAEDVSQQALLSAYTHMDQFQGNSRFSTWLTRIVINEALMKVRKRRSEDHYLCYDDGQDEGASPVDMLRAAETFHPDVLYTRAENQRALREAISGLRASSQVVIWLLGLEERRTKEAAKVLHLSQSAVKTRLARARQQLRESLTDRM